MLSDDILILHKLYRFFQFIRPEEVYIKRILNVNTQ